MASDLEKRITAKMVLDSTGFNSSMQGVNAQLKLAQSELKASSEQVGVFGNNTDKLRANCEGLSKQIELQRQKVDIYRDSIDKSTEKLQSNIKARDELKKSLDVANTKYSEAVNLYGKESSEANSAKEAVNKLTDEYKKKEKQIENNAKQISNYTVNMNKASAELSKMQGELQNTNTELDKSNNKWISASNTFKDSSEKLKSVGEGASNAGDKILKLSAPLVGIGIAAAKVGIDFDAQMSRVKAISGAVGEDFEKLNNQALQLGADTAFSAKQAAEGMENLASAGFNTTEIMQAMPGMLDLAASSGEDLASSADIAASTLRGFGLAADQAGHVADVLAKNAADTNAAVADTGEAMKYVAPVAHAMGLSLEEVTASIGIMANAGIKGSQAGTTLRGALSRLADPSKEAAGAMRQIGFEAFDSEGKLVPLKDLIDRLQKSTQNLTMQQKQQAISTVFGQEAMSGMLTLIDGGSQQLDTLTQSLKNSNGAAKNMATTMQDNAKSSVEQMMGSLETAGIKLEKVLAPNIIKVADYVGKLADKFAELGPETQETILKTVAFSVGLGGVLKVGGGAITTVGNIAGVVGKLSGVLGTASEAAEGVGAASTVAAGVGGAGGLAGLGTALGGVVVAAAPWLIAGAAVAGTGYAIYKGMNEEAVPAVDLFADKVKTTTNTITTANGSMVTSYDTTVTKISEGTQKAVGAYLNLDTETSKSLTNLYVNSTTITENTVSNMTGKYNEMANQIKTRMDEHFTDQYNKMDTFFKNSSALTDTEEKEALAKLQQNNTDKKAEVDKYTKEIHAILQKASDEKRALTLDEQQKINVIQNDMKVNAVQTLSDSEVESKVILERLKDYSTRITTEQASDVISNAEKQRKESVEKANQQYDETVKSIVKMRDGTHSITAEQADRLIEDATRQKDESIQKAEEMKAGIVEKVRSMNSDILDDINVSSGAIKTNWDKLKDWFNNNPITGRIKTIMSNISTNSDIGSNASGTSNWRGGLTTLNENGYEVYDLPQGTRIYNHDASEDLIRKTAESMTNNTSNPSFSFEGMFKGANFSVRSDSDIKKIAQLVGQELYSAQKQTARGRGINYGY